MSTRLLTDVWHNTTNPWSRTELGRLLRGIDLARAQRNLSRVEYDFRTGRDSTNAGHGEARSSASGAVLPEVVVGIHSSLSLGDPLPEMSTEAIATIAASKGIPITKERLRRPPTKPLHRLTHRTIHAIHENAKDPVDGAHRALETVIRLDDWFLGADKVSGSGAPAGSLTQAAVQTGSGLQPQKGVQPGNLVHSEDTSPKGRGQAHQDALDTGQTPLEGNTIEPSSRTVGRIAGFVTPDLSTLEGCLETGEWEVVVSRDAVNTRRLWIRGPPLIAISARVMLVEAQSPEISAEMMFEAATAPSDSKYPPQARRFSL